MSQKMDEQQKASYRAKYVALKDEHEWIWQWSDLYVFGNTLAWMPLGFIEVEEFCVKVGLGFTPISNGGRFFVRVDTFQPWNNFTSKLASDLTLNVLKAIALETARDMVKSRLQELRDARIAFNSQACISGGDRNNDLLGSIGDNE